MSEPHIPTTEKEEQLSLLAREFALLLSSSNIDEEIQATLIDLLPFMELGEMLSLISTLEAKYTNSTTSQLDTFLEYELSNIQNRFEQRQNTRDKELLQKLTDLTNNIS